MLRLTGSSNAPNANVLAYLADGLGSITATASDMVSGGPVAPASVVATGSNNEAGNPASRTIDGDTAGGSNNFWVGNASTSNPATLTFELGSSQPVSRVKLYRATNYNTDYTVKDADVQVRLSNNTWQTVASLVGNNTNDNPEISFAPTATTAIKVLFKAARNSTVVLVPEVTMQLDNSASSVIVQRFDAWGNPTQSTGNVPSYGYTGREPDVSGLMFYRARYYIPAYGRFASRDPIGMQGGINPYAYVDGNPVNFNDPSGLLLSNVGNTANQYYGATTDWLSANNMGTRALGGLQFVGGVTGMLGGGTVAGATGWTGIGAVAGVGLATLSADQASAGLQTMLTGQNKSSLLNNGLQAAGLSPQQAAWGEAIINVGSAAGASSLVRSGATFAEISGQANTYSAIGSTGKVGETYLKTLGGRSQAYFDTTQGARYIDQLISGAAHESKVGYAAASADVRTQVAKDVELLTTGQINSSTWHFFPSPVTGQVGPSTPLLNLLQQSGIGVVIH